MGKSKKQISLAKPPPPSKIPRTIEDIDALDEQFFKWRVRKDYVDFEHEEWGWQQLQLREFFETVLDRLHEYEKMSWHDVLQRPHCHPLPINQAVPRAQDRLSQKSLEIDLLHQVDFSKLGRIWGHKIGQYFYLIWYDPKHTVCPVNWH